MPGQTSRRQQLEEERLRYQLELQSQQIEKVFDQHQLSARVAGGTVKSRAISFDLAALALSGWERLRELTDDLKASLGTPGVQLGPSEQGWRLQVPRPDDPPVALLDLLAYVADLPPATAVLGLAEDGHPVALNFGCGQTNHILISGGEAAGKTVLLRTLATSLALTSKQSQLQLILMHGQNPTRGDLPHERNWLAPLNFLPHLLHDIVYESDAAVNLIDFLVNEMQYRQEQSVAQPVIVVLIDNVVSLLRAAPSQLGAGLMRLAQRGSEAGIHLVLSTRRPEAKELDRLLKANLPVRLVGRVEDAQEAAVAAARSGTQAEYLLGQGDFLAVMGDGVTHFQAAHVGDYDLHMSLRHLHDHLPVLLAQPFDVRASLPPSLNIPSTFIFNREVAQVPLKDVLAPAVEKTLSAREAAVSPAIPDPLPLPPGPAVRRTPYKTNQSEERQKPSNK